MRYTPGSIDCSAKPVVQLARQGAPSVEYAGPIPAKVKLYLLFFIRNWR
jgi:hypothetical protein